LKCTRCAAQYRGWAAGSSLAARWARCLPSRIASVISHTRQARCITQLMHVLLIASAAAIASMDV